MADVTKYQLISNGGNPFADHFRTQFSLFKTRRKSMVVVYGFMFFFVAFTIFLAFTPSSSSSTVSSSSSSSIFSDASYRSHFSSVFSYFFPNSSQLVQDPVTVSAIKPSRSRNSSTLQVPISNNSLPTVKKEPKTQVLDKGETFKSNQTVSHGQNSPVPPPVPVNSTFKPGSPANLKGTEERESCRSGICGVKEKNETQINPQTPPAPVNRTAVNLGSPAKKAVAGNITGSLSRKQGNESHRAAVGIGSLVGCDLYEGEWVRDDSYPLYKPGSCSLIDEQFNCIRNGRPDADYQKLKWKPKGCSIPRLNGARMLKLLRGKRLVFVGDSLNRNMWESLVCILRNAAKDRSKVYEAFGRHQFRTEASYSFIFKDYNCSVEFFVSPFLVQQWEVKDKNGTVKETLRLDLIVRDSNQFKTADVLVFNTGHWWTHEKTSRGQDYYQEGSHVYSELNVQEAFRRALTTWARWIDANINPRKTHVLFRGYSSSHFSGGQWNSGGACDSETEPIKNQTYLTEYPWKMQVFETVIKGMKTPISYLNVTRITDYRKDGHPSIYRKEKLSNEERRSPLLYQDCSHWCLPGVPDTWNELLYAEILRKRYNDRQGNVKT